ncbi:hypothetical protein [Sphaerisporangium rhizosphaerae]|uniref:Uncharacterized protein n=1 Tax=Sphaerisporangium rhizosphaerae TaxID=2269375 RepID=A0ABW2P5B3_9ACTN
MPNGKIFMTPGVLRDLTTGNTYDIPAGLRDLSPVNTLVTYTLASASDVGSITPGVAGTVVKGCGVDETGQVIPFSAALRGAYPEGTRLRLYGTLDEVGAVDALKLVIGDQDRRVDVVEPARSAPVRLSEIGVSIEQDCMDKTGDAPGQQYYHVGAGTAWTTRIHTCTALAMWSRTARISYLSHADAGTSSQTIAQHMTAFLTQATAAGADLTANGELSVVLFTASDSLRTMIASLRKVVNALDHLAAAHTRAVYTSATCHITGPDDAIVVSADAPPKVLLHHEDYLTYLMDRYRARGEQATRAFLAGALSTADKQPGLESTAGRTADRARERNDRELYVLLASLVGFDKQTALKAWGW